MKKLAAIFFVFAVQLFAQSSKGNISLVFNDEKFDMPIRYININKDDNIKVNFRAEQNDSLSAKWISMELSFANLGGGKIVAQPKDIMLQIQSNEKYGAKRKSFLLNYGRQDVQIELYDHGERMGFSGKTFQFNMYVDKINYNEKELKISGTFSMNVYKKSDDGNIQIASSVKDGKFEIIL